MGTVLCRDRRDKSYDEFCCFRVQSGHESDMPECPLTTKADISSAPLSVTSGTIRDRGRSARPFLAWSLLRRRLDIVQRKLSRKSIAAFIAGLYRDCS